MSFNLNLNGYRNQIDAFTVRNLYSIVNTFLVEKQKMFSGNVKLNTLVHLPKSLDVQLAAIYLAPTLSRRAASAVDFRWMRA